MDISYQVVDLECPSCRYAVEVLVKQVIAEEKVLCPGCYAEIQLVDEGGSARRVQSKIDEALASLERQLRRFGR
jgi:peptide subunit release factor 1 (eRF1)